MDIHETTQLVAGQVPYASPSEDTRRGRGKGRAGE